MPTRRASSKLGELPNEAQGMGLLDLLRRKPPVSDLLALSDFLDSRAAFLVQKCLYEYARARSGILSSKLFKEAAFKEAMEPARWGNYPLCLQHVTVMVEHTLRAGADGEAGAMREGLIVAAGAVCRRYPVPKGFDAGFWRAAEHRVAQRVRLAGLAAPRPIKDLPQETASEFMEKVPIHADLRQFDFELVTNNLRVNLCRAHEEFGAMADAPALVSALIAAGSRAKIGAASAAP
jgi:hypothetical protein